MLSTTSEYALRALAHLAAQPQGVALLGRDLAQAADIPANYLSKILLTLRNAELVDTTRGSGGGYRLHKPAEEIFLIDIVELFDGISRTKPTCFLRHQRPCSTSSSCSAHVLWRDVQARYLGFLVSTPLSALAGPDGSSPATLAPSVNLSATRGQR
jgi:Rrf2 family transcriptional regulator, iron-sulfur cluster assembly transcription factor